MKRPRPSRLHLVLPVLLLGGCQEKREVERVGGLGKVDELWFNNGVCVRVGDAIRCAHADDKVPIKETTPVAGLGKVKDIAVSLSWACALDEQGVACFRPGAGTARRLALEAPLQVIAERGEPCILHANGVSCLDGNKDTPQPVPDLGKPQRLLYDEREHFLCGVDLFATRCVNVRFDGKPAEVVVLTGAKDPQHISINAAGAEVYVQDGDRLRRGSVAGAKVYLDEVPGFGGVRTMIPWSPGVVVLDGRGVALVDYAANQPKIEIWKTKVTPTALYRAFSQEFATVENDRVHLHGRADGKAYDRELTGIGKPVRVRGGSVWWTCILDDQGAVGCTPAQKT